MKIKNGRSCAVTSFRHDPTIPPSLIARLPLRGPCTRHLVNSSLAGRQLFSISANHKPRIAQSLRVLSWPPLSGSQQKSPTANTTFTDNPLYHIPNRPLISHSVLISPVYASLFTPAKIPAFTAYLAPQWRLHVSLTAPPGPPDPPFSPSRKPPSLTVCLARSFVGPGTFDSYGEQAFT